MEKTAKRIGIALLAVLLVALLCAGIALALPQAETPLASADGSSSLDTSVRSVTVGDRVYDLSNWQDANDYYQSLIDQGYTEITDQVVVTAPELTKIQGFGTTLKGFIYYTTDATKLGCVATIGTDKYCETVADAVANAVSGDEIKLLKNITVDKIITPKPVTVTAVDAGKTYGEADPELTVTVSGTLNGETVEYTVAREEGEDVDTYPIHVTGDEDQGNYLVSFVDGNFTVTARAVTITAHDAYKIAGAEDPDFKAAFGVIFRAPRRPGATCGKGGSY